MNNFDPPKDYAEDDYVTEKHGIAEALENTATRMGMTDREERKQLIREAMTEAAQAWLDARYKQVGKWSVRGIAAAGFAALAYFVLTHTGWVKP